MAATVAVPVSSSVSSSSTPATSSGSKYRGAVIEDLQLPPAFSLPSNELLSRAIELAYDRDFSHIPILHPKTRSPVGHIDVATLKKKWESSQANPDDKVDAHMSRFKRSASHPYKLITPWTELEELEEFLKENDFALVTDNDRKFVIAVATSHDLEQFVTRRGF
ncbi:hypothetical protein DL96DRAFT_1532135 [Flagelloscypha sp. PMI_526]|nr:hypothetical protein DL96DRAFT_1532135 [Flagelloscypha sp. PMI_526]